MNAELNDFEFFTLNNKLLVFCVSALSIALAWIAACFSGRNKIDIYTWALAQCLYDVAKAEK